MELDHFGQLFSAGYTLSIEERASLEVQMAKKQMEENLHRRVSGAPFPISLFSVRTAHLTLHPMCLTFCLRCVLLFPCLFFNPTSAQHEVLGSRGGHNERLPRGLWHFEHE